MQSSSYSRLLGLVLALALLFSAGCNKKKPAVPPPQAQAPTVTNQQPEQKPEETQPTQPSTQPPQEQPPAQQPQEQPQTPEKPSPSKPKHSPRRHSATSNSTARKPPTPAQAQPPAPTPSTAAAKPPDADVGQISPDMSRTAASQAQQSTTQLLDATEQNLRALTRTLSNDEQNTVSQIRSYVVQARSALKDQDLERAHNLALKAHQLSDVLLRQ